MQRLATLALLVEAPRGLIGFEPQHSQQHSDQTHQHCGRDVQAADRGAELTRPLQVTQHFALSGLRGENQKKKQCDNQIHFLHILITA